MLQLDAKEAWNIYLLVYQIYISWVKNLSMHNNDIFLVHVFVISNCNNILELYKQICTIIFYA